MIDKALKIDDTGKFDYSGLRVAESVAANLELFKQLFENDETVRYRAFESRGGEISYGAVYIDGMTDQQLINQHIIKPVENSGALFGAATIEKIEAEFVSGGETSRTADFDKLVKSVISGDTLLFIEGQQEALIIGTKGFATRSISEPDSEKALKGPREGFNEALMTNLSLLRRKLQTADLKFVFSAVGTRSGTKICVCYLDSLVDKRVLGEVQERLGQFSIDGIFDSNYVMEYLQERKWSLFKTVGSTEKPDILASRLLEGRVAIFTDGSPFALTVPHLFIEDFQSPDDYYLHFVFASIGRFLRVLGFWLSLSVPAIYVALVCYHPEIIPTPLLLTIAATTAGTPFPVFLECIGMLGIFETLRETGIRSSNKIGQALSIVGGLVVGQAAVEAKIVSAPMVIIIALTGITGLITPRLTTASVAVRFAGIIMAALGGILGYYFVILMLLIHLLSLESFGYPYMQDFFPARRRASRDSGIRAPLWMMRRRPDFAADKVRR